MIGGQTGVGAATRTSSRDATMATARTIADAVLYEGYLLYPYRASARKNQVRWQFGILSPPGALQAGVGEESTMRAECLVEAQSDSQLDVQLRFLQLAPRAVEQALDAQGSRFEPVAELRVGDSSWVGWDEAVEQTVDLPTVALADIDSEQVGSGQVHTVDVDGGQTEELVHGTDGSIAGRLVRTRTPLSAVVRISAEPAGPALLRVRLDVENVTDWKGRDRESALARSTLGTHLVLAVTAGAFVSLLEPPDAAQEAAEACTNLRCWPVLVGDRDRRDVLLASPIILYDFPAVAPESAGELYDSTEIDEILTLRVMTLTDEEKDAARATDPRAAAVIDRCDTMSPVDMERLHGALRYPHQPDSQPDFPWPDFPTLHTPAADEPDPLGAAPRWWDPVADANVSPSTDAVRIAGVPVSRGSRVLLRPTRRADAQDIFLAGQVATVDAVHTDVDGNVHVAVALTDDRVAALHTEYNRFYFFGPEEIEPLTPDAQDPGDRP